MYIPIKFVFVDSSRPMLEQRFPAVDKSVDFACACMCICTSMHLCKYILTSVCWLRAHSHSHLRVRSHLHTPSVDYTARAREADYTAKEERVNTSAATAGARLDGRRKTKNQLQCTEDIVLHRRMRWRQRVHQSPTATRQSSLVARGPGRLCSRRVVGCVRSSIHKYACAHTYTCPMSTTPPESAKLTTPPKSAISPHKRGQTHPAQTKRGNENGTARVHLHRSIP